MIRDISNVDDNQKLYMIYNKDTCFSPSVKNKIRFVEEEWREQVTPAQPKERLYAIANTKSIMYNQFLSYTQPNEKIPESEVSYLFRNTECIMESDETIYDFMSVYLSKLKTIKKKFNPTNEEFGRLVGAVYKVIIPWKIGANVIKKKCDTEIRPTDENLWNFHTKINKILFQEVVERQDEAASALVIYNLLTSLGLTLKDTSAVEFLLLCKSYVCKENSDKILSNLKKLFKNENESLSLLDKISIDSLGGFGEMILNFSKRKMEDNYKKSKVSEELNSSNLMIGNDVFDNTETNLSDIIMDLDKLNEEEIKRYVGKGKMISYFLDERENGYLRKELKVPMCKVLRKGIGFLTVISDDEKKYLMFKIQGNNKLFGISFPPGTEGNRMLTKFEIPEKYDYKLIMSQV